MGAIQATEVLKWILGVGLLLENKLLIADLLKMTFREIQLSQNPDCPLCVHHQSLQKIHYPTKPAHCLSLVNHSITAKDMRDLLKNSRVTLVDVRSIEEHDAYNIGGKPIPLTELPERLTELDSSHLIILYCYSSQRSIQALNMLIEAGFASVKYLIGGISSL